MDAQGCGPGWSRRVPTGGFALLRANRRALVIANVIYYGLLIVGLGVAMGNRELQTLLLEAVGQAFGEGGLLASVGEAYGSGRTLRAIGLTFVINLAVGSFASMTLPSLIVPFSCLLMAGYRALLWGVLFSPAPGTELTGQSLLAGALLVGLLILEGEAYVLTALAAWLQGRSVVVYRRLGYPSVGRGYLAGLKQTALLYVPIAVVLLVAAVYEVIIAAVLG